MMRVHSAVAVLVLLLVAQGCAANRAAREAAENPPPPPDLDYGQDLYGEATLRVGYTPGKPPIIFLEDGQPAGLEADFARAIAEEFETALEFVPLEAEDHVAALMSQRVDILMTGLPITEQNRSLLLFCRPYLRIGHMALVRREDRRRYRTENDVRFTEVRVATEEATPSDLFVQERMRFCTHFHVDSVEVGADALLTGQIDMLIAEGPSVLWLAERYANDGLVALPHLYRANQYAWAVHPDNMGLWYDANIALGRLTASGRINTIMNRWLPQRR